MVHPKRQQPQHCCSPCLFHSHRAPPGFPKHNIHTSEKKVVLLRAPPGSPTAPTNIPKQLMQPLCTNPDSAEPQQKCFWVLGDLMEIPTCTISFNLHAHKAKYGSTPSQPGLTAAQLTCKVRITHCFGNLSRTDPLSSTVHWCLLALWDNLELQHSASCCSSFQSIVQHRSLLHSPEFLALLS